MDARCMLFTIKWLICQRSAVYTSASKSCALYLAKKFSIVKACKSSLLNRRSELVSLRTSQETSSSHAKVPRRKAENHKTKKNTENHKTRTKHKQISLCFHLCLFTGFFCLVLSVLLLFNPPPPPPLHTRTPPSPHAPHS